MKRDLADSVGVLLLNRGYLVKRLRSGSFDLVARREADILLIKILRTRTA